MKTLSIDAGSSWQWLDGDKSWRKLQRWDVVDVGMERKGRKRGSQMQDTCCDSLC